MIPTPCTRSERVAMRVVLGVALFWIVVLAVPMTVAAQRSQIDRLEARVQQTDNEIMNLRLEQRAMRVQIDRLDAEQSAITNKLDQILTAVITLLVAVVGWLMTNMWGRRQFNKLERNGS